jgi:alpha-L-fucosidase 2
MTYRPFTLEGNFAFASAIQEMLIQSHTGVVKLFPAIPSDWKDVSFNTLRTHTVHSWFLPRWKMAK